MYLFCGVKHWEVIRASAVPTLFDPQTRKLRDIETNNPDELVDIQDSLPTYKGTIQGGDFVYIPIGWPHRVRTDEKSFGLSGYVNLMDDEKTNHGAVVDLFEREGLDNIW